MVGIVNKVYYFLLLTIIFLFSILIALVYPLYFIHLFIPLPFYTATVPSFLHSFIHSTLEFGSMISLHQSLYGQVFKPHCSIY